MIEINYSYVDPETKFIVTETENYPYDMGEAVEWAVGRITFDFPPIIDLRFRVR